MNILDSYQTKSAICASFGELLLDSSLIIRTNYKGYTIKIIQCGEHFQIYKYAEEQFKKNKKEERIKDKMLNYNYINLMNENDKIMNIDTDNLTKNNNKKENIEIKEIEYRNIMRSKFQLQRLVKSNESEFKTFITLTFADNITSIEEANKMFDNWRRSVKRIKANFKYVCVPEFQKRGAVHYHLLTNLDIKKDKNIIFSQRGKKKMYDVKYWNKGFTSVYNLENMNVVGYITKYMNKNIDNRLFGKRRYLYSRNLIQPIVSYINLSNSHELKKYNEILEFEMLYENQYLDKFGEVIEFKEYKKNILAI